MRFDVAGELERLTGLRKRAAYRAWQDLSQAMASALQRGEKVSIPRVGTLRATAKRPTRYRHPQTGVVLDVAARKSIQYRPSTALLQTLRGRDG